MMGPCEAAAGTGLCTGSPPSPFAASFDSPEHSDVLLRVYTDIALPQPSTKAGKKPNGRTVPAPAPAAAPAARTYHCHAIILASYSGYFKAQLSQPWQQPQPRAQRAAARYMCWRRPSVPDIDTQRTVDIHVEAEELDALHELLRMLYSQALPAAPPGDPAFFQCLKLADRFEALSCIDILIAGLAAAATGNFKPSILSYVLQGGTPGVCVSRSYPALLESCSKALVQLFGDVPTVIEDEALLQQFCSLPHPVVLAWVKSDDLQVHSENCVVFLLTAWVQANQGSTAAQHEELAHQVRVFHLGPAYLHGILPNLSWFKGCSSMEYMPAVLSCIRAGMTMSQGLEEETSKLCGTPSFVLPPGWCAKPRSRSSSPRTCAWVFSPSQLKEVNDGNVLVLPSPVSIDGFLIRLHVQQNATDPSAPAPGKTLRLGLYLGVDVAAMAQRGLPLPDKLLVRLGPPRVKVGSDGSEQRKDAFLSSTTLCEAVGVWGCHSFLDAAAPSLLELVAPYLDAGQLHIEAGFNAVDA